MANELTVTKEQTARYVHDAVEMETAVFTLDRAIEECERRKEVRLVQLQSKTSELYTTDQNVRSFQRKIESIKHEQYDSYRKNYRRWNLDTFPFFVSDAWKVLGCSFLLGLFAGPILLTIVLYFICGESWTSEHMTIICIIGVCLLPILVIVFCLVRWLIEGYRGIPMSREKFEADKKSRQNSIKQQLASVLSEHAKVEQNCQFYQSQMELLDTQISDLRAKRNQVASTLSRFYNLGVIPPDYRYMDCAVMLDQIFRNDLADTMREAINKYEERVFRGEVIKGMDRICRMLGNLSAGMMAIEQRLNSIDSNVKMMSQDFYTFSERIAAGQAKQQKATEELLKETELNRYATERVAESAKNLEWHERRRQGWV